MGRTLVIAGLGTKHPGVPVWRAGMEVWGINDCYQHVPEVKRFTKIFNIHKDFPRCIDDLKPGRFKNWRNQYEKSKALIVTATDLGLSKQRILDITKLRKDNPDYVFCSSLSYCIFEAVERGYDEIRLYRFTLDANEYAEQFHGIVENIRWAQAKGVKFYWPWFKKIMTTYKGLDIELRKDYGEIPEEKKESVPITETNIEEMTTKEIRDAIKALGGNAPGRCKKDKLIQIYNDILQ